MNAFECQRIVVAVDPSGASGREDVRSDEIGIVVAAKLKSKRYAVLADKSMRGSPQQRAAAAVNAYREFGADLVVDNSETDPVAEIMELTSGLGVDVAIEAVGIPETFELCAEIVRPGGHVANVGVHGAPATLHLEKLWIKDVTITTGLVDTSTTPRLLELIANGRLDPSPFATHRFELDDTEKAYETFADAASTNALKVVLSAEPAQLTAREHDSETLAGAAV